MFTVFVPYLTQSVEPLVSRRKTEYKCEHEESEDGVE